MTPRRENSFKKFIPFLLFIVFFMWMCVITVVHIGISRSGRKISRLQNEVAIKEARNQYLQLEIARLSSPEVVINYAKEQLGLQPIKPHEIILLDKHK